MNADELVAYWARLGSGGVHPDDSQLISSTHFDTELHPVPWVGPLKTARNFVLFLNPGLSPADRPYESSRPEFVQTLRDNLAGTRPYFYLLDRYSDHPGHAWARSTFGHDISQHDCEKFCVLQLVPYHSVGGAVASKVAPALPSSTAARRFVQHTLLPLARAGSIHLIVARSAARWGLGPTDERPNLVVYQGAECRRAYLTPGSRGGRALRSGLGR